MATILHRLFICISQALVYLDGRNIFQHGRSSKDNMENRGPSHDSSAVACCFITALLNTLFGFDIGSFAGVQNIPGREYDDNLPFRDYSRVHQRRRGVLDSNFHPIRTVHVFWYRREPQSCNKPQRLDYTSRNSGCGPRYSSSFVCIRYSQPLLIESKNRKE